MHPPPVSFTVELQSWNLIGVSIFTSVAQSISKSEDPSVDVRCTCTCTTTPQILHHRIALVELHRCTKFRVARSKFPEDRGTYAPYHEMACTIKIYSLNSISVPNLVSIAQSFLKPEDPMSKKFSASGACSLHPTGTATTKAHRLGLYTCDLQVWHQW